MDYRSPAVSRPIAHFPLVKSGISTTAPPLATDIPDRAVDRHPGSCIVDIYRHRAVFAQAPEELFEFEPVHAAVAAPVRLLSRNFFQIG